MAEHQLNPGEPTTMNPQKQSLSLGCCDCGLTHHIEFIVSHRQKLTFALWRDNRKTAGKRRARTFPCRSPKR